METVLLGCPTYSEEINTGSARGLWLHATNRDDVQVMAADRSGSLIPASCNNLWCAALNIRQSQGLGWFAMLHADIEPEPGWLDKLLGIAAEHNADMVSVVVPLKDDRGITSTAIASEDETMQFCRLTQRQVWHQSFPETFDIYDCANALERLPDSLRVPHVPRLGLRLNTGCMLVRLKPEVCTGDVYFENVDWIEQHRGEWRARDISEDWRFSQKVQAAGGKLLATRAVRVIHKGIASFPNDKPWGVKLSDAPALQESAA